MKIALIGSRGIPASYSGFETFYENLGVRLAARGHQVTFYNRKQYVNYPNREYKGVKLITFPTIRNKHLDTLFHTFVSILHAATQRYDIAYICIVGNSPLCALTRALGMKTILNVDGEDWKREKWRGWEKKYLKLTEYIATIFPNIVISDSEVIRERYLRVHHKDTIFIPYGANVGKSEDVSYIESSGLKKDGYILFVGRLVPENNAHLLIEAFNRIQTDFKLVIVGDAPYSDVYKNELRKNANGKIIFTGYQFGETYRSLSSHCYLFVLPSGVNGTRPVLLDQMGFANCVLVNSTPANMEVIGDAGLSFNGEMGIADLQNKLELLLARKDIVHKYRERATLRMQEDYSWESVTLQYENLFAHLCPKAFTKMPKEAALETKGATYGISRTFMRK